jgi:hypothetical protein
LTRDQTGCNASINQRDHHPDVGVVAYIDQGAKVLTAVREAFELANTHIEGVMDDDDPAGSSHRVAPVRASPITGDARTAKAGRPAAGFQALRRVLASWHSLTVTTQQRHTVFAPFNTV